MPMVLLRNSRDSDNGQTSTSCVVLLHDHALDTDRIVEVWIRQHDTMGSYVVRASGVPLYVGYGSVFSIVSCIGLKLDRFVMQMALLLFHARTSARPPMTTEPTSPRHVGKHAMLARLASCPFMSLSELFDTCVRHDRTLFLLLVLIILQ